MQSYIRRLLTTAVVKGLNMLKMLRSDVRTLHRHISLLHCKLNKYSKMITKFMRYYKDV